MGFKITMFPHFFLTAFLTLMSVKCARFLMCESDADCQDGYSCIENICKICVNCSLIFRKGNNCESNFNDCGDCLEGYKEISVTDNSAVKKPCKQIRKKGNLKDCATDNNCPPDSYCSEKSCVNCFDCSLLNRLKPEKCARDPNECGACFIGYLSTHIKTRNYNKCTEVPPDHMPHNMSSGSTLVACVIIIVFGAGALATFQIRYYKGCERQQQAKVFKSSSPPDHPLDDAGRDEISESDSGLSETSNVPDQPTSAQREETISSHGSGIYGECARSRSLSSSSSSLEVEEVNSINSGSDSQGEQSVDVNALSDESAGNNSHLVWIIIDNPAEIPEDPAKEQPTEDMQLNHG